MAEQKASEQAAPVPSKAEAIARQLNEVARQVGQKLPFEAEPSNFLASLDRLAAPETRS